MAKEAAEGLRKHPLFRFVAALVERLLRKLLYELTVFNSTTARFHFFAGFGAGHLLPEAANPVGAASRVGATKA